MKTTIAIIGFQLLSFFAFCAEKTRDTEKTKSEIVKSTEETKLVIPSNVQLVENNYQDYYENGNLKFSIEKNVSLNKIVLNKYYSNGNPEMNLELDENGIMMGWQMFFSPEGILELEGIWINGEAFLPSIKIYNTIVSNDFAVNTLR